MNKLHIGAGDHILPNWINVDLNPTLGVLRMDATKAPYPFDSGSIGRIFSEHMIEHVPFGAGRVMLKECFRVLMPGGRIRISHPSLDNIATLGYPRNTVEWDYIEWACKVLYPSMPVCAATVINGLFRGFGHQFIWSETLLRDEMYAVGFREFVFPEIEKSIDPEFVGLENSGRMPPGFLQVETATIEAEKPSA